MKNTEVRPNASGLVHSDLLEVGTTSLPGEGGTTFVPGEGGTTFVPGEGGTTFVPGEGGTPSVPGEGGTPSVPRDRTTSLPRDRTTSVPGYGVAPASRFHRTRLPHFEAGEVPQHICFRLADSLPRVLLQRWKEELRGLPVSERDEEKRRRIESTLDKGLGACWLRHPEIARAVAQALHYFDGSRYRLHAWVVMPNHVHVLVTLIGNATLSGVLHSWKSYTVRRANEILSREGRFWQPDYFDRFVRDERHYRATIYYIHQNPVKAGLCKAASDWRWSSARAVRGRSWG